MIYNINYDICAIVISLFSVFFILFKKGFKKKQNKVLLYLMVATVFASFFDIISAIANSYTNEWSSVSRELLNCAYFLIQNTMPLLFYIYTLCLAGIDYKKRKDILFGVIISLPFICDVIIIVLNPIFHWVFYFNEQNVYVHNNGITFLYAIAMLYMVSCYFIIFRYGKNVPHSKKAMVHVLLTACLATLIVQIFKPYMLLQLFVESLCMLGILFTIDNEDEITDFVSTCYNRRAFIYDNNLYIKNNSSYHIVVVKLPNLNYYSITMGMKVMNGFMKEIGVWLRSLNLNANVYYCDNGNFAIICNTEKEKKQLMKQIIQKFRTNWNYNGMLFSFHIKLWAADMPKDIFSLEQLLFIIDSTIKEYRTSDGNEILGNAELYEYKRELAVEKAIEKALREESFMVYYQPIWYNEKNSIISAEALIRLYDDELGYISPDEFIPIAERKGYIIEIGNFVLESVCRFFSEYQLSDIGISYIEVNLSALQCMSEKFIESFVNITKKYSLQNSCINLEITESTIANNAEVMENTIKQLNKLGFTFSMDDYGTGYSNFTYIYDMPFEIIKLDKNILWRAKDNERARTLLANTIRMIKEMNMKTVVEGVETEEQKILLQNLGCDFLQGYYFSKPIPKDEFYKYCISHNIKQTKQLEYEAI